tara:strand:- start:682 stop:894 length:213 start_codon:yes stop_codon:yes gene_type:complete
MNYIEINPKLYEYYLKDNGKSTGIIYKLTLKEAKIKNYAFRLNRVNKQFVLTTTIQDKAEKTIIVLPKGY